MIQASQNTIVVENPAEILINEKGTFEVISPYAHFFQVICRRDSKMNVREVWKSETWIPASRSAWQIT